MTNLKTRITTALVTVALAAFVIVETAPRIQR